MRDDDRPGRIHAVPVRHPGDGSPSPIILVLAAMFVSMLLTNPAFDWSFIFQAMQQTPVLRGFYIGTLLVTVCAMLVGVVRRASSSP